MKVLLVNHKEVLRYLPMGECIDVMEGALRTTNEGNTLNPLRTALWLPDERGLLGVMPGYLGDPGVLGLKTVTVFPGNDATPYHSHQGSVMIFDTELGCPLAIMDAAEITAVRTAAVSGVATKLLANQDPRTLAILGSGVQARTHLAAMTCVRDLEAVRVWSRTAANAAEFVESESEKYGVEITVASTVAEAVDGADIVCTTTAAQTPILEGAWLSPGAHVNAVGSSIKATRELDTQAVARSRVFVDRIESTVNESGDYLFAKEEGAIDEGHLLGELGDISLGKIEGRKTHEEITLFISLGLAIEDIAAAHHIYKKLEASGEGNWVALGSTKYH
jgi:ornithine cyclodeaminase